MQGQVVLHKRPWLPCGLRQCTWRARRREMQVGAMEVEQEVFLGVDVWTIFEWIRECM